MRIAYVYDTVYPETKGGVEKRVWELARRLVQRGHDVHILVPKAWEGPDRLERQGVVLQGVSRSRALYTKWGRRAVLPAMAHALSVLRFLRHHQYDLVDCQTPALLGTIAAWWRARRNPDTRIVITWHEVWGPSWVDEMGLIGHVGRQVESIVARLPATHLSVSEETAETLLRLGRRADAIVLPGATRPAPEPTDAPASDVLFVGRMIPTKNLGLLIEAVAALVARGFAPQVLVIGEGPQRSTWERQVESLGLAGHVAFLGSLESDAEVMAVLRRAKILALPSVREGFGMIALEAAAHGVPVVTVDHPRNAARHLVEHGATGLCVPPSVTEFTDALQALLEDEGLRQQLALGARVRAHRSTWDAAVDDTEAMYGVRVLA